MRRATTAVLAVFMLQQPGGAQVLPWREPGLIFDAPDALQGFAAGGSEPLGAEDASAEDDLPRIPEPMVFDLVRPLGARRGEFEINVLGIVPIGRAPENAVPNALGLSGNQFEWAPEFEYAFRDNWAVEVELPFESDTLAAYKAACQATIGTAFDDRFIHGVQAIAEYERHGDNWLPTVLYLAGLRIDSTWSVLGMIGVRGETAAQRGQRVQRLLNLSLFADVGPHTTIGVETNLAVAARGDSSLLVMPQWHQEFGDHFMIQAGAGGEFTGEGSLGQGAFRVIRTF